jgi:APA family basic amino acid/polyamine antiporter
MSQAPARLRPLIGTYTGLLIGTGVAVGSGIFRNPGLVAEQVQSPPLMLAAWLFGGVFFTLAGMVTAELSTRFPRVGGEYVFLRHAYGEFAGFFFGWAYTVFVVGGGIATMGVALGDFTVQLLELPAWRGASGAIGAAAILSITAINLGGLRAGATTQNLLTLLKVSLLLLIVALAVVKGRAVDWWGGGAAWSGASAAGGGADRSWLSSLSLFGATLMPVMWCYEGTTDSVKLSEEIRDPRRAMPRALIGAGVVCTCLYLLLNWAFLRVLTPAEMAETTVVPEAVLTRWVGPLGGKLALGLAICVVLGGLSSTIVSCVRVPFALARDGMMFSFVGRMSRGQAPVGALLVGAGCASAFAVSGTYTEVLSTYTISTGVLFGLVNFSLVPIRRADRRGQARSDGASAVDHFRCPAGTAVAVFLAAAQFAIAAGVAWRDVTVEDGRSTLKTAVLLAVIGGMYLVWPKPRSAPG